MQPLIVLAADAESRSDRALPVVAALALAKRAHVLAINVHDGGRDPRNRAEAEAVAARAAGMLAQLGIESSAEAVTTTDGQVASAIARVARDRQAYLVALGTHAHGSLGGLLMGSVSHRVLALTQCQVLIAPGPAGQDPVDIAEVGKVMLAVDQSLESAAAAAAVESLAAVLRARVLVVHVSDALLHVGDAVLHVSDAVLGRHQMSRAEPEDGAQAMVRRYCDRMRLAGVKAEWTIPAAVDAVPERIASMAEDWEADLIVVGSRRNRDLVSVMVGSVVHRLGQLTTRPILVAERPERKVPAGAEEHRRDLRHLAALGQA
jgi:nucleotide-binding universal stress UspA family protein